MVSGVGRWPTLARESWDLPPRTLLENATLLLRETAKTWWSLFFLWMSLKVRCLAWLLPSWYQPDGAQCWGWHRQREKWRKMMTCVYPSVGASLSWIFITCIQKTSLECLLKVNIKQNLKLEICGNKGGYICLYFYPGSGRLGGGGVGCVCTEICSSLFL